MTHICVGNLIIIGSDNGLSPGRRQSTIWTNTGILLIWPLGTNFNEILIGIQTFSFKKMHLKMSSAKWRPFCLGLNVLIFLRVSQQETKTWSRSSDLYNPSNRSAKHRSYQQTMTYFGYWCIMNFMCSNVCVNMWGWSSGDANITVISTHGGLGTPFGDKHRGQNWLT